MSAAERWLAARGVWKVQLLVREDNVAVRTFYERLGYRDTRSICLQKVIEGSGVDGAGSGFGRIGRSVLCRAHDGAGGTRPDPETRA